MLHYRFDQNQWTLRDFKNNNLGSYYKNDVKLMVVWNMHCFSNQSQLEKFHSNKHDKLSLDKIIETFKADLKLKNKLPSDNIEPIGKLEYSLTQNLSYFLYIFIKYLDLWTIALKEYLNYPKNTQNQITTIFGFNYCLLPNIMPEWLKKIVNFLFLNDMC